MLCCVGGNLTYLDVWKECSTFIFKILQVLEELSKSAPWKPNIPHNIHFAKMKFPHCMLYITVFTRSKLNQMNQFTSSHHLSVRFVLLSCHLFLDLVSGVFPSGLLIAEFLLHAICATSSSPVILHNCLMLCGHYVGHWITAYVSQFRGLLVVVFPKHALHCHFQNSRISFHCPHYWYHSHLFPKCLSMKSGCNLQVAVVNFMFIYEGLRGPRKWVQKVAIPRCLSCLVPGGE